MQGLHLLVRAPPRARPLVEPRQRGVRLRDPSPPVAPGSFVAQGTGHGTITGQDDTIGERNTTPTATDEATPAAPAVGYPMGSRPRAADERARGQGSRRSIPRLLRAEPGNPPTSSGSAAQRLYRRRRESSHRSFILHDHTHPIGTKHRTQQECTPRRKQRFTSAAASPTLFALKASTRRRHGMVRRAVGRVLRRVLQAAPLEPTSGRTER